MVGLGRDWMCKQSRSVPAPCPAGFDEREGRLTKLNSDATNAMGSGMTARRANQFCSDFVAAASSLANSNFGETGIARSLPSSAAVRFRALPSTARTRPG